jgi:hypothetical protein
VRHVHNGTHVFDDEANTWFGPFDDPDAAFEFAGESEAHEHREPEIDVQSSTAITGRVLILANGLGTTPATGPVMVASYNPARKRLLLRTMGYASDTTSGVYLGSRAEAISGVGYALAAFSPVVIETTAEVWACIIGAPILAPGSVNTTVLTVLEELEG